MIIGAKNRFSFLMRCLIKAWWCWNTDEALMMNLSPSIFFRHEIFFIWLIKNFVILRKANWIFRRNEICSRKIFIEQTDFVTHRLNSGIGNRQNFFCSSDLLFQKMELIQWIMLILGISKFLSNSLELRFWIFAEFKIFENFHLCWISRRSQNFA